MFVIATVVVVTGGYTVYKMKQWTKSIDEKQQKQEQSEETSISMPNFDPNTPPELFVSLDQWWLEWVPDLTDGNGDLKSIPKRPVRPLICITLDEAGQVHLSITNDAAWIDVDLNQLTELDSEGIPVNWRALEEGVSVTLQKTSALPNWEDAKELRLRTNCPVFFEADGRSLYRTRP